MILVMPPDTRVVQKAVGAYAVLLAKTGYEL